MKKKTYFEKIPDSVGFPSGNQSGGGVVRKLTPEELKAQKALQKRKR